jgi:hypothetical protein
MKRPCTQFGFLNDDGIPAVELRRAQLFAYEDLVYKARSSKSTTRPAVPAACKPKEGFGGGDGHPDEKM